MKKLAIAFILLIPAPVAAQVEITPVLGMFLPAGNVFDEPVFVSGVGNVVVEIKQQTSVLLGARVTSWVNPKLGFEGSFLFAPSGTTGNALGISVSQDGNLLMTSGRVLLGFPVPGTSTTFHLLGGPTLIKRGGDAYDGTDGTLDIGLTLGGGARFGIGPKLSVRVDLEDNLSSAGFEDAVTNISSESKFQNDFVLSVGLAVNVGS